MSDAADFFVLCSATSEPHVRSLADDLVDRLRQAGERPWHVEGRESLRWVLIDLVDIVIHVFRKEARDFYALERLWGDAAVTRFEDRWNDDEVSEPSVLKSVLDDD